MFRTELHLTKNAKTINHQSSIITMGSCFSEHMGDQLLNYKFKTLVNPFGIIFNPVSIFSLLNKNLSENPFSDTSFVERDGFWYHKEVHSCIFATSKKELQEKLKSVSLQVKNKLENADWLIITPGTSIVYHDLLYGELAANCHKLPNNQFKKSLLTSQQIKDSFKNLYENICSINPNLKILFTVSPVRHIKDTIQVNSHSKAILITALSDLAEQDNNIFYFPSYEIMMDDLRDYRFYKEDMIHPSEVALSYIWNKFCNMFFEENSLQFIKKWSEIRKSLLHKPFNPSTEKHQKFLLNLILKLENLSDQIDVSIELEQVKEQLI